MDIKTKLDVLFVSAECIPFCANGGVADMCYALPKYLNKTDKVNVRVVLPLYSKIPEKYRKCFTSQTIIRKFSSLYKKV